LGKTVIDELDDADLQLGYCHLESDVTIDAIADADLQFTGTHAQGCTLMGSYGIARNASVEVPWFLADVITGSSDSITPVSAP
jgi:hypothetical protein